VARVEVTARALADLERLFDFLAEHNPKLARERMMR
jgi:plasmid stabilization system protein ParE